MNFERFITTYSNGLFCVFDGKELVGTTENAVDICAIINKHIEKTSPDLKYLNSRILSRRTMQLMMTVAIPENKFDSLYVANYAIIKTAYCFTLYDDDHAIGEYATIDSAIDKLVLLLTK